MKRSSPLFHGACQMWHYSFKYSIFCCSLLHPQQRSWISAAEDPLSRPADYEIMAVLSPCLVLYLWEVEESKITISLKKKKKERKKERKKDFFFRNGLGEKHLNLKWESCDSWGKITELPPFANVVGTPARHFSPSSISIGLKCLPWQFSARTQRVPPLWLMHCHAAMVEDVSRRSPSPFQYSSLIFH